MPVHAWRLIAISTLAVAGADALHAQAPVGVRLPGYLSAVRLDSGTVAASIPASPGAVFWAARQIFSEFKIPTPEADSARGYLVNRRFIKLRSLAGSPLSTFLNCGTGITGPNADAFRVTMAIGAFIEPAGPTASRLRLNLVAGAESTEGASKSAVACASTGVLEERLARLIRTRAARP